MVPTGAGELLSEKERSTSIRTTVVSMVFKLLAFAHDLTNCTLLLMTAEVLISS